MPNESEVGRKPQREETMLGSYRVLDLTGERGLYCGALLGNLGADVIKVEKPGGDPARSIGPFYNDIPDPEKSLYWLAYNTNKRGITLNIEASDGIGILKQMVRTADVVIESFEPGHMDKLGLNYPELEKINPGIVMTSITPFGQAGPYVDGKYKASDLTCWALGGMLFSSGSTGRGPVCISHVSHAFVLASADAAWSTVMALYWRGESGEGQHIDVSIIESVERAAHLQYVDWQVRGIPFERLGANFTVPPIRAISQWVWAIKDGYLAFHITGGQWGQHQVRPVVEWMDEEGMADEFIRNIDWGNLVFEKLPLNEAERIRRYFENFFKTRTRAEVIEEALTRDIPLDVVYSPEDVFEHPQLEARDYWQKLEHSDSGLTMTYPGYFCKASETVSKLWRRAPHVGEHNEEVYLNELGFTKDEIAILRQRGII